MKKYEIPSEVLQGENIKLIIESINYSVPQYINHVNTENLPTQNGKYHEIWNYIFKNIKSNFSEYPYECYTISRGNLWEFIAIYNHENNILYVLMKEERFNEIKNGKDKDCHYLKVLNCINNKVKKNNVEQLSLFKQDKSKKEYIENDLARMLGDINGKVKMCVDILFSTKQNKVTKISGNIFDYNLDVIKSYCWNKYIKADIDEIIDTKYEYDSVENPPIELKVKKHSSTTKEKEKTKEMVASKGKQRKTSEKK